MSRIVTLPRGIGTPGFKIRRLGDTPPIDPPIDPPFTGSHPEFGDEFNGKLPSWIDVTTLGVVGDGVTDNTIALQAAINSVSNSTRPVLYFPAGTYGISQSNVLHLEERIDIALIGENPLTTKIKYIGPDIYNQNKWLIRLNGVAYSKFSRFTFDGDNKIKILINQEWCGCHNYFDTGNEYSDCKFENARVGIDVGWGYYGGAETAVMRCYFKNLADNGISMGNFNALDMWVWDSLIEDCGRGLNSFF